MANDDVDHSARKALVEPFAANEVHWRVGSRNKDKTKGIALPYVESRVVMKRLDEVFGPAGWSFTLREVTGGFIGQLTTTWPSGVTTIREDVGASSDIEPVKGGASDALKRAGVQLGIGRYLYYIPTTWVKLKSEKYLAETPELPRWALPSGGK